MVDNPGSGGGGGRSGITTSRRGLRGDLSATNAGANGTFYAAGAGGSGAGGDGGDGGNWGLPGVINSSNLGDNAEVMAPGYGGKAIVVTANDLSLSHNSALYTSNVDLKLASILEDQSTSVQLLGNFRPKQTGPYFFRIFSDDTSKFWFNSANLVSPTPNINVSTYTGFYSSANIGVLTANVNYPIRVQMAQGSAGFGVLKFEFAEINPLSVPAVNSAAANALYTTNGTSYFYSTSNTGLLPGLEMKRYKGDAVNDVNYFTAANEWSSANGIHGYGDKEFKIGDPQFIGFSANAITTGTSIAINRADIGTILDGDALVITVITESTGTITLPAGFTTIDSGAVATEASGFFGFRDKVSQYRTGYKFASSEGATYTTTVPGEASMTMFAVRGASDVLLDSYVFNAGVLNAANTTDRHTGSSLAFAESFKAYANQLSVVVLASDVDSGTNWTTTSTVGFDSFSNVAPTTAEQRVGVGYKKHLQNERYTLRVTTNAGVSNDLVYRRFILY